MNCLRRKKKQHLKISKAKKLQASTKYFLKHGRQGDLKTFFFYYVSLLSRKVLSLTKPKGMKRNPSAIILHLLWDQICVLCGCLCIFGSLFNDISTIASYLMLNPLYTYSCVRFVSRQFVGDIIFQLHRAHLFSYSKMITSIANTNNSKWFQVL